MTKWAVLASLTGHVLTAAAIMRVPAPRTLPPLIPAGMDARPLVYSELSLDALPPQADTETNSDETKPDPAKPDQAKAEPEQVEPKPPKPKPPEPKEVRLGQDDGNPESKNWIASTQPGEHSAPKAEVEQAFVRRNSKSGNGATEFVKPQAGAPENAAPVPDATDAPTEPAKPEPREPEPATADERPVEKAVEPTKTPPTAAALPVTLAPSATDAKADEAIKPSKGEDAELSKSPTGEAKAESGKPSDAKTDQPSPPKPDPDAKPDDSKPLASEQGESKDAPPSDQVGPGSKPGGATAPAPQQDKPGEESKPAPAGSEGNGGTPAKPTAAPESEKPATEPTSELDDRTLEQMLLEALKSERPVPTTSPKPRADDLRRGGSAREAQVPGKPGPQMDTDEVAWVADKEADPTSLRRVAKFEAGKVEAGQGLEILTLNPQFDAVTRNLASPRSPVFEVKFNKQGEAKRVRMIRSSGTSNVNDPIQNVLYKWRARGKVLEELPDDPDAGVVLRIRFLLSR